MQPAVSASQREGSLPYKWIVAGVVIFGLFMTILDTTIVNIAIPRLQDAFGAGLSSVQWVLTGYTLAQGVATPLTAFLSQRLGQKQLYLLALTGFTIGSALCGLSINLPMLIVFRIIQGATGAFMTPLAITTALQRISTRGARISSWCSWYSDPACPRYWTYPGRIYRHLFGMAVDLLHQCAYRHHWDYPGESFPPSELC